MLEKPLTTLGTSRIKRAIMVESAFCRKVVSKIIYLYNLKAGDAIASSKTS